MDWIPTSERLPKTEGGYLTTRETLDGLEVAELYLWFDEAGKHWAAGGDGYPDDFQRVTAWAEMPKPYVAKTGTAHVEPMTETAESDGEVK